ncbi:MAG: prephenate dehydratase domain-containing protein [Terriglobales bacterium]
MRIAIQGVPGCFSEAAMQWLRPRAQPVFCRRFEDIFATLASGGAEAALVPVHNTLAGEIAATRTLLRLHPMRKIAATRLRIELCLMIHPSSTPERIVRVLSHPVALAQCGHFLGRHPGWKPIPYFDTAGSAGYVMLRRDLVSAAIAPLRAVQAYGTRLVERDMGDTAENYTTFQLLRPA